MKLSNQCFFVVNELTCKATRLNQISPQLSKVMFSSPSTLSIGQQLFKKWGYPTVTLPSLASSCNKIFSHLKFQEERFILPLLKINSVSNKLFFFSSLVDLCVPGEIADVTGIVKLSSREDRKFFFH